MWLNRELILSRDKVLIDKQDYTPIYVSRYGLKYLAEIHTI